jgi:chromosome segregation ATPase
MWTDDHEDAKHRHGPERAAALKRLVEKRADQWDKIDLASAAFESGWDSALIAARDRLDLADRLEEDLRVASGQMRLAQYAEPGSDLARAVVANNLTRDALRSAERRELAALAISDELRGELEAARSNFDGLSGEKNLTQARVFAENEALRAQVETLKAALPFPTLHLEDLKKNLHWASRERDELSRDLEVVRAERTEMEALVGVLKRRIVQLEDRFARTEPAANWEDDHQRRSLEALGLAEEFPWGCDSIQVVGEALIAARQELQEAKDKLNEREPEKKSEPQRVTLRSGWGNCGRDGTAIGPNIELDQPWTPVLWDGEEDPEFFKTAGLIFLPKE